MVSLSTKQRGVAVVAVLTLGLLFGIALLMMYDTLPMSETNLSSGSTVSMTFYTLQDTDLNGDANTYDDFKFVNTANGKVVQQYTISDATRVDGGSKTVSLTLNEELGELFCLCITGSDVWDGKLKDFNVDGVNYHGSVSIQLDTNDDCCDPCWRLGIESDELVDKGHSETCSLSNSVVSMTLHTLSDYQSETDNDFRFVNSVNDEVVVQYKLPVPGHDTGKSKTVSVVLREELGQLFCLCTTGDNTWNGEISDFKLDGVSFPGLVTPLKLSVDDTGYYPCWRLGIESNELVDKGHSQICSFSTTAWFRLYTKTNTDAETGGDLIFVSTDNGKVLEQHEITQPGRVKGESTVVGVPLKGDLGDTFCLCATGDDAWDGEIHGLSVYGVSFLGEVTNLKLSTDDSGYYRCWRFGIDEESKRLLDKGHSDGCN